MTQVQGSYSVKPLTEAQAKEYKLDPAFYKKVTMVHKALKVVKVLKVI